MVVPLPWVKVRLVRRPMPRARWAAVFDMIDVCGREKRGELDILAPRHL